MAVPYAFTKIGRMPVNSIDQTKELMYLSPIWTYKHETAKRLLQQIKMVLDQVKPKGFRSGENLVTAIRELVSLAQLTTVEVRRIQ